MELNFKEEWKDVEGYESLYQVSNLGRVKSLEKHFLRAYKDSYRTRTIPAKILKPFPTRTGYLLVKLTQNKTAKCFQVHRLVANAFIPNPQHKPQVNHINGVKTDNYISNLEWVTAQENTFHKNHILGFKFSEETKENMRKKKLGISLNEQTRKKMSEAHKGKTPVNAKKVKCINTGKIYNSAREASLSLNLNKNAVSKAIKRKTKAGNLYWEYIN